MYLISPHELGIVLPALIDSHLQSVVAAEHPQMSSVAAPNSDFLSRISPLRSDRLAGNVRSWCAIALSYHTV